MPIVNGRHRVRPNSRVESRLHPWKSWQTFDSFFDLEVYTMCPWYFIFSLMTFFSFLRSSNLKSLKIWLMADKIKSSSTPQNWLRMRRKNRFPGVGRFRKCNLIISKRVTRSVWTITKYLKSCYIVTHHWFGHVTASVSCRFFFFM